MKFSLKAIILFLVAGLAGGLAISPTQAQMTDSCGASFMILPDGSCLNLGYLPILGESRGNLNQANAEYTALYNANIELSVANSRVPAWMRETEEERENRYETLAWKGEERNIVEASHQRVEMTLWPLHLQAMDIVGNAFR